jgi:DNA invertase Pin-like site-specific DNA recombinase
MRTAQLDRDAQRQALTDWAASHGIILHWYEEVGWHRKGRGRQFTRMLTDLDRLDLAGIAVTALDNLVRDGLSLIQLTSDLCAKDRQLLSLLANDEKIVSSMSTLSRDARAALMAVADFDRRVRTRLMREGLERKRLGGWKPGREPKAINWKDARLLLDAGASVAVAARMFGLSRAQFWRRMQTQGVVNPRTRPFGQPKPRQDSPPI